MKKNPQSFIFMKLHDLKNRSINKKRCQTNHLYLYLNKLFLI